MPSKLQEMVKNIMPFIILGIMIAFSIIVLIMFSYVLMWGVLIGAVIWLIALIKNFFFPKKNVEQSAEGRIIEHNDDDNNK